MLDLPDVRGLNEDLSGLSSFVKGALVDSAAGLVLKTSSSLGEVSRSECDGGMVPSGKGYRLAFSCFTPSSSSGTGSTGAFSPDLL